MKNLLGAAMLATITLTGCGGGDTASDMATIEYHMEDGAQAAIKSKLRDPDSAQFSELKTSRKGGVTVVCGKVNSNNGFGGKGGPQRFISNGDSLAFLEEEVEGGMGELWARFC